jgi:hypothetical protein
LIVGIKQETEEILLAYLHGDIPPMDMLVWMEYLEHRAPPDFACQFTKAVTWALHGQESRLVAQLKDIVADRRFATRH